MDFRKTEIPRENRDVDKQNFPHGFFANCFLFKKNKSNFENVILYR